MFIYKTMVHLSDTDETGVLFYPQQFRLALEAFEHFLKSERYALGKILAEGNFLLPVVHAEADYLSPLFTADDLEITLRVPRIGNSSFTLSCKFENPTKKLLVGTTSIIHVAVSKATRSAIPIPGELLALLKKLEIKTD